jgi:hypothetical protein
LKYYEEEGIYSYQNQMMPYCQWYPSGDTSGCFRYYPDEWMTFQIHVVPGPYGTDQTSAGGATYRGFTNSTYELWVARENQPSVLVHRQTGLVLQSNDPDHKYGKVWLLPFNTNKDASEVHQDASTWYDELIISRSRIPDPMVETTSDSSPTIAFSATPTTVAVGENVTLNWSSSNATLCQASDGWSGMKGVNGSETITNLTQSTTFALTCSGDNGSVAEQVRVTVSSIGDTALAALASSIGPKEWIQMNVDSSLPNANLPHQITAYADGAVWDSANQTMFWVGSQAHTAYFGLLEYDAKSDTWTENHAFDSGGHSYDGLALNPHTGELYFQHLDSNVIKKYSNGQWTNLPALPYPANYATPLVWFPDMDNGNGALVHIGPLDDLAWFDGSSWHRIPFSGINWGSFSIFAQYNPVTKTVWFGGGSNNNQVTYKLDRNLNLTRMPDAPFTLHVGRSMHSVDPVSGKYLVINNDAELYEFDINAGTWTPVTESINSPLNTFSMNATLQFHVPIPELGVIMFVQEFYSEERVYLYKHSQ